MTKKQREFAYKKRVKEQKTSRWYANKRDQLPQTTYPKKTEKKVTPVPTSKEGWYAEYLLPEWVKVRIQVLNRDNNTCTKCGCTHGLHVHHTYYSWGKHVWEYPTSSLITLCEECHKKTHEEKPITEFYL